MENITIQQNSLPSSLEDLSKFILVATEKVQVIRAEIRAIDKLGLAREVYDQKVQEAQMLAEAMIDAEVRIGHLTSQIPKGSGRPSKIEEKNYSAPVEEFTKEQAVENMGFSVQRINEFEQMAKHPDIVEQAKAEAVENNAIVTKKQVLKLIRDNKTAKVIEIKHQPATVEDIEGDYTADIHELEIAAKIRDAIFAVTMALSKDCFDKYADIYICKNADVFSKSELLENIQEAINRLNYLKTAMCAHKNIREVKVESFERH